MIEVGDKAAVKATGEQGTVTMTNGHAHKVCGKWYLTEELERKGIIEATGQMAIALLSEPSISALSALRKLNVKGTRLSRLPDAVSHCLHLEFLEVSGNPLQGLPDAVALLPKLDTFFAAGVGWTEIPKILARCPKLRMVGVRDNKILSLDGECLPECLVWLIAAGNKIESLPNIARLKHVRKLMLSHNCLTCSALEPVAGIDDLEMVRVAANRLEAFPQSLMKHRRLAWVAVGGNPFAEESMQRRLEKAPAPVDFSEVSLGQPLGKGAGATVYQGKWRNRDVAVKIWEAERFSDGTARGEWAASRVASNPGHSSMVKVLSAFEVPKPGMILELLQDASAAAGPPLSSTVTRDALPIHGGPGPWYSIESVLTISRAVAEACAYLYAQGLMHGDVYLHNTLVLWKGSKECAHVVDARLSDLGASAAIDDPGFEKLEVRSFGWLLQDLLESLSVPAEAEDDATGKQSFLQALCSRCLRECTDALPTFAEIVKELETVVDTEKKTLKLNTSNEGKYAEFKEFFAEHGFKLERTAVDLPEIDASPRSVIAQKASMSGEGVISEDTSLDVDGADVGVNVRWLVDNLGTLKGRGATWTVLIGLLQAGEVEIFRGVVRGTIVEARGGGGFGFDPYFLPEGASKTLAEEKPKTVNARYHAVAALAQGTLHGKRARFDETAYTGKWQH